MPNKISSFRDLPLNAKNYILMHTIGSPLMIGEYALVVYLLFTGYKLIEIGLIYTVMEIIAALCPYLVGKRLDKGVSIKKTMALVFMFEGIAFFLFFYIRYWGYPILLVGLWLFKFATMLYVVFPTYEHYVYPENIREKALVYHLIIPEYTQIIFFPIFGIILTFWFPSVDTYRYLFLILFIGNLIMVWYVLEKIEDIKEPKFRIPTERLTFRVPRRLYTLFSIEIFLFLAGSILPIICLTYFILIVLHQSFFILMILEALNSAVTIFLGSHIKRKEINRKLGLILGVIFFLGGNLMFVIAGYTLKIIFAMFGIIFITAGNILWFPIHRTLLFDQIPEEKRGSFLGSMSSARRLISLSIPFISSIFITLCVYLPFAISIFLYTISIIGYWTLKPKVMKSTTPPFRGS